MDTPLPLRIGFWALAQEHREALLEQVAREQAEDPGAKLAVGTGWASAKTFFEGGEAARALQWHFRTCLPPGPWLVDGWANVMERLDHILPHNHAMSHRGGTNGWAGVYFLEVPDGPCAPLTIHLEGMPIFLAPHEGMVVIFPADVPHEVPASIFDGRRVSIAFNARRA